MGCITDILQPLIQRLKGKITEEVTKELSDPDNQNTCY